MSSVVTATGKTIEPSALLAIVVVRDGVLPAGADEAVAEANGHVVVIGDNTAAAVSNLRSACSGWRVETTEGLTEISRVLAGLAPVSGAHGLVLPASPDGRDIAPLLAHRLQRPLHAAALCIDTHSVTCVRTAGRVGREYATPLPFVATLIPGIRGITAVTQPPTIVVIEAPAPGVEGARDQAGQHTGVQTEPIAAVRSVEVLAPDPSTMDLTEAQYIVSGGLGLGSKQRFDQLGRIGAAIGASLGGTRVASDAGWIPFDRQIGTTGVAVEPIVYVAFGISGATQHTSGLGDPAHVISVNTDPSCPMMTLSDLAIVTDAHAVLDALERQLLPTDCTADRERATRPPTH